jgi:hypothetical protein
MDTNSSLTTDSGVENGDLTVHTMLIIDILYKLYENYLNDNELVFGQFVVIFKFDRNITARIDSRALDITSGSRVIVPDIVVRTNSSRGPHCRHNTHEIKGKIFHFAYLS